MGQVFLLAVKTSAMKMGQGDCKVFADRIDLFPAQ